MVHHWSWTEFYIHSWGPASFIFAGIMVYSEYLLLAADDPQLPAKSSGFMTLTRIAQCVFVLCSFLNQSFNTNIYSGIVLSQFFSGLLSTTTNLSALFSPSNWTSVLWVACVVIHDLLVLLDIICDRILLEYRAKITVLTWLESKLLRDFIPAGGRPAFRAKLSNIWSGLWQSFRRGQGAIAYDIVLSEDDDPSIVLPVLSTFPTQLHDDVLDWSRLIGDPSTQKALWITVDRHKINTCASDTIQLLSAVDKTISVDASKTKSVFWPLLHGLGTAWPEFKQQLARSGRLSTYDENERLHTLLLNPLEKTWKIDPRNSGGDCESQQHEEIPRIIVIIHGIRNLAQALEMYDIIKRLPLGSKSLNIIAITAPQLLREIFEGQIYMMEHIYTLSVSEIGTVIYSGKLPSFNQNLLLLMLEGIFRSPNEIYERLWIELCDPSASPLFVRPELSDDDLTQSTLTIFRLLHKAAEDRKQILKFFSNLPIISQYEINDCIDQDNVEIALMLQWLVEDKAYKQDIPRVPEKEGFSVLNLTHHILDRRLPENHEIQDEKLFRRRAHRLLNILADFLKIVPEELGIHGVVLLRDRPVKYGGFADIYHGQYTNSEGENVEVALKVLRVFQDQSDDSRNLLLQKFAKEALVWHYLKHPNVVPFLGIDAKTFPTPAMAMVSHWMSQGNILNYMAENSPVSRYAISLLNDVIQGLMYLHSQNVVHGDLCGRNILIDERQAYLTDFGLAAFVESDSSIKTSTRSGSTRWMAPELHLPDVYQPGLPLRRTPASDVWAFGCVCCEIWTEGQIPFARMSDGGLILALSAADPNVVPYKTKPRDKADTPMPERLWELIQSCFKLNAANRPATNVIAEILSEMKDTKWKDTNSSRHCADFVPGGSGLAVQSSGRTSSPSSDKLHLPPTLSPLAPVRHGKAKRHVHFEEGYATVRFGPLPMDGVSEVEELFDEIFAGLLRLVLPDVLRRPLAVEIQDSQYVHLQFRSPLEANNFAMTWIVYRYDPYKEVFAVLVDN